jgi:H+/gluconate symporter-like permease
MAGIAGILIALALLMYLAYRGLSILILAPALALLAAVFDGGVPLMASYTQVFMSATGNFIILYFPVFLLGAIFGKLMDDTGSARAIAQWVVGLLGRRRSILAVVVSCAILTYGGVSLFVVAFAIYPIASALFREADIPKRLIPATIALGAFTFTMTALPGTPAIQNAIPMPFFGTTPFAAPGLGLITGAIMFTLGMLWLNRRSGSARAAGEGYGEHPETRTIVDRQLRERSEGEGFDIAELADRQEPAAMPHIALAAAPVILVVALNYLFSAILIPRWETGYLQLPLYGATDISAVRGIWAVIAALVLSILILIASNRGRLTSLTGTLDSGASASVLPIFNTASLVGFGAVIASLGAFALIRSGVIQVGGANPLISLAVSVSLLAGMTGSASGGMSIALQTLGDNYVEMANQAGIPLELMHRITSVATGGLDSLPHNGAVVTLLAICGLTHRDSYKDIFMVAVIVPIIALVVLITLGTFLGSW